MEPSTRNPVQSHTIRRVLGPIHVWALGVGIVLVGEFMGWNLTIKQGGSLAALLGLWVMSMMYVGRIGPVTMALVFAGKADKSAQFRELPEENVMLG